MAYCRDMSKPSSVEDCNSSYRNSLDVLNSDSDDEFQDAISVVPKSNTKYEKVTNNITKSQIKCDKDPHSNQQLVLGSEMNLNSQNRSFITSGKSYHFADAITNKNNSRHINPILPDARLILPSPASERKVTFWSIIKNYIGKDLTKITLPVIVNQPLSFTQSLAEIFDYLELIDRAITCHYDVIKRMEYVLAFHILSQAYTSWRLYKHFNPLLGETFELRNDTIGFFFLSEQVSHHPPIQAVYMEMPNFRWYGDVSAEIRFWGNIIEVFPNALFYFSFMSVDDKKEMVISVDFANTTVKNLIIGNVWVERHGVMTLNNHLTGHKAVITFKKVGWFSSKNLHQFEGYIEDRDGRIVRYVYGNWTRGLWSCSPEAYRKAYSVSKSELVEQPYDAKLIASVIPRYPEHRMYYDFTTISFSLNELKPDMTYLPPTDSRLRPDVRCLEMGLIEKAADEKHRLEEKQRAARRKREHQGRVWSPLWFEKKISPFSKKPLWTYNGAYIERNFEHCPDLY